MVRLCLFFPCFPLLSFYCWVAITVDTGLVKLFFITLFVNQFCCNFILTSFRIFRGRSQSSSTGFSSQDTNAPLGGISGDGVQFCQPWHWWFTPLTSGRRFPTLCNVPHSKKGSITWGSGLTKIFPDVLLNTYLFICVNYSDIVESQRL